MSSAQAKSDELRNEAKRILNSLLSIPEGYGNGQTDRLVDCVIGAAVLEVAAIQQEAAKIFITAPAPGKENDE